MRARKKKWTASYIESVPDLILPKIDEGDPFWKDAPLYLEIGTGKGDFIIGMAKKIDGHFLGIEKVMDVIAVAGKKTEENQLNNVKFRLGDFDGIYEEIKNMRFENIYLNFSDPWPKKKHWRRRLTERNRLLKITSLLSDEQNASIIMKTDNDALYEFSKEEAVAMDLLIKEDQFDYHYDEINDVMSEYERNFRSKGLPIHRLVFVKKGE